MTFNVGHITGGTQSRCRVVKQAHSAWSCACEGTNWTPDREWIDGIAGWHKLNPGWRGKCDSCGETRPT